MSELNRDLSQERCLLHWQREAVARCVSCNRYFCRECVTEHEERMICSSCLSKIVQPSIARKPLRLFFTSLQFALGIFTLWIFFYYLGQTLLLLPASFHDGTMWNQEFLDN